MELKPFRGDLNCREETRLNRTFMELKPKNAPRCRDTPGAFESHLYGIETCKTAPTSPMPSSLNRTFMELKHIQDKMRAIGIRFESHLYGIETYQVPQYNAEGRAFESHLYGIETG